MYYYSTKQARTNKGTFLELVTNGATVKSKEVYKRALMVNAINVIFSHNHPSGDTTPSGADIMLTKALVSAGDLLGIEVLDHVIVSDMGYYSLKANEHF